MPKKRLRPPVAYDGNYEDGGDKGVILLPEILGMEIRRLRSNAGLLQWQLAERLYWPQSVLSRMERGDARIGLDQLYAIVYTINDARLEQEKPGINAHDLLARVETLGHDLVPLDYYLVWCTGPEWPEPERLVRGQTLAYTLGLIDSAYPP